MQKRKFSLGFMPIILVIILLFVCYLLIYNFFTTSLNLTSKIISIVAILYGLIWVYYVITNSTFRIDGNEIYMPQKYSMNPVKFFTGNSFILAIFKKRESINIRNIKSVDIATGFGRRVEELHKPMTITMKGGQKHVYYMKFYSKNSVVWILRNLKSINPKINFSRKCKELINT